MGQSLEREMSWEDAIQMVQRDLEREFLGSRSREAIQAVARESVTPFAFQDVRIRTFVPILAGRTARRRLKEIA